jgi:transcriptional regulator with XRE-family HTH domain
MVTTQAPASSTIADILRRLLDERGLSPKALDEAAGLGADATRNVLRGRSAAPRSGTLQAMADALGVPVATFFGEADPPAPPAPARPRRRTGVMLRPRLPEPGDDLAPALPGVPPAGLCDIEAYDLRPRAEPSPAIRDETRHGPGTLRLPELPITLAGATPGTVAAVRAPGEGFPPDVQPGAWILVDTEQTVPSRGTYVLWDGAGHLLARLVQQPTAEGPKLSVQLVDGSKPNSLEGYEVCGRVIMRFATM